MVTVLASHDGIFAIFASLLSRLHFYRQENLTFTVLGRLP